jgi:hypothetical protein
MIHKDRLNLKVLLWPRILIYSQNTSNMMNKIIKLIMMIKMVSIHLDEMKPKINKIFVIL